MKKEKTLKENIQWLIDQYKKELEIENSREVKDYVVILNYENIIYELEFALQISK